MKKKKLQILDLFAGCGGLSQGFRDEGFSVPFANEFWKPAQDSYEASHKDTILFKEDIRKLTNEKIDKVMKNKKIKKIDIIIGGPPCQGFSMAGSRKVNDPRNKLFIEFVRIVNHLEPLFFVFENVKGLLTMKSLNGEKIIDQIINEFKKVDGGYDVKFRVLNSADYGVPQKRERVILIGARLNVKGTLLHPIPTHAPKKNLSEIKSWFNRNGKYFFNIDEKTLREVFRCNSIKSLPMKAKKIINKMKPWKNVIEALKNLEKLQDEFDKFNHRPMNHTSIVKRRMALIQEGRNIPLDQSGWKPELKRKKFASVYKRLHRNEPACTMVPGHSAFPIHYKLNRSLTVREASRIQTLPDSFKFFGNKTEQCLVVGNAVPSLMAREIAKKIKKLIKIYLS